MKINFNVIPLLDIKPYIPNLDYVNGEIKSDNRFY